MSPIRRGPRTRVDEVGRPFRVFLVHPNLGVVDAAASAPASRFGAGDVAASTGPTPRWFVGGHAGGDLGLTEVVPGAVVEDIVDPGLRGTPPGFVRGYVGVMAFDDRAEAEPFARWATEHAPGADGSGREA